MMTVVEMVKMLGKGEFDSVSEAEIGQWEEFVDPMVSKKQFGKLYNQAKALLICHNLAMAGAGNNSALGALGKAGIGLLASSVSDGGSSISFANGNGDITQADGEYGLTAYGVRFLQLRRLAIIPIRISGEEELNVGI